MEKQAHKHKTILSGDCLGEGGGLPTGWPGVKCLGAVYKHFRPGTRPGGSVTRGEMVDVLNVYVPFWPLESGHLVEIRVRKE